MSTLHINSMCWSDVAYPMCAHIYTYNYSGPGRWPGTCICALYPLPFPILIFSVHKLFSLQPILPGYIAWHLLISSSLTSTHHVFKILSRPLFSSFPFFSPYVPCTWVCTSFTLPMSFVIYCFLMLCKCSRFVCQQILWTSF